MTNSRPTRWWAGFSPSHPPLPTRWHDGGHAATPTAHSSSTATASPFAAGARRGALPARPLGCRLASFTIVGVPPPATCIRANVPERVAMLLTGHKSRAIFDRYNIINEQELLDAGDQLVESVLSRATGGRRYQPASGPTRPDPLPRAPHHPSASYDAAPRKGARPPGTGAWPGAAVAGHRPPVRRGSRTGHRYEPARDRGTRSDGAGHRYDAAEHENTSTPRARLRMHPGRLDATRRRRATPRQRGVASRSPPALVHDSKLTVNDPNPEASHRPILCDSGGPSSVIWFRTLHATTDSATRPPRDRARSRSPIIDLYRKNAFSTRAWRW